MATAALDLQTIACSGNASTPLLVDIQLTLPLGRVSEVDAAGACGAVEGLDGSDGGDGCAACCGAGAGGRRYKFRTDDSDVLAAGIGVGGQFGDWVGRRYACRVDADADAAGHGGDGGGAAVAVDDVAADAAGFAGQVVDEGAVEVLGFLVGRVFCRVFVAWLQPVEPAPAAA